MKQITLRAFRWIARLLVLSLLVTGLAAPALAQGETQAPPPTPKNVIVMISDGWSINAIMSTSYYRWGVPRRQQYHRFPFRSYMSTHELYQPGDACHEQGYDTALAWGSFDWVKSCATDSAAAATAMSTAVKTYDGYIGMDVNGQPLTHALQVAEAHNKATGVVSTVEWTHATPAGFVAHNISRNNYEQIGVEMVNTSTADVIMGAGHPCYDNSGLWNNCANTYKYVGGTGTWSALLAGTAGGDADGDGIADPWTLVQTRDEFQALMKGSTPKRVLGTAQAYTTMQQARAGDAMAGPYVVPLLQSVPTLAEMSRAALNVLDNDPDGFFLMIEGGAVDWAAHANQSGRLIEEQTDFDDAVQAVLKWVERNSNWNDTLLIVTGDHETGYLWGPGSNPGWNPIVNNGQGNLPGMEWHSGDHTNSLIPFYATGTSASLFTSYLTEWDTVRGFYLDNTNIADVVLGLLNQ